MATKKTGKSKRAKSDARAAIGIIGGSGLYSMAGLTNTREIRVKTPFGDPSETIVLGTLEGKRVAFLARHGRGHRILPSEINYRANVYAMKLLGVERIISVSAVGSLTEDLRPGEFLVPDQFFDRTKNRICTFFGEGIVAHVAFAHPTCGQVSDVLADACVRLGARAAWLATDAGFRASGPARPGAFPRRVWPTRRNQATRDRGEVRDETMYLAAGREPGARAGRGRDRLGGPAPTEPRRQSGRRDQPGE